MKKIFFFALAAIGMTACMQDEIVTVQQNAIEFKSAHVDNATRAAADPSTTVETIADFNVWGFMDQPSGYVFTGDKVQRAGEAWTYANTQYWAPDHTYYFAAVSPAKEKNWELNTTDANTFGPGILTFTNKDGDEDLLYAAASVKTPRYDDLQKDGMEAVKLQFNHLLSKVKFTFANGFTTQNASVEVKNIKMTAPEKGTIALNVENWWDNDDWTVEGTKELAFGDVRKLSAGEKDECTQERLTLPVNKEYEYTVTFDVVLYTGELVALETTKKTTISGTALEMGKAYNFAAEINPENLHLPSIEFEVEVVKDWVTAETPNQQVWESEMKAAALLGGSYTLPGDIVLASPVVVPAGTHFTVDLNGHNITSAGDAFEVAGGNLTINGDGLVYAATENGAPYCAVWAYGDGYVRINGGEYKIGYPDGDYNDLIYAKDNAQIDIYGGYFHNSGQDNAFVLNIKDRSNADITVYGGTFEKFNPADNASENPRHSFVAEGYVAVETNDEWNVIPGEIKVSTAYDFEAALAAKYQKIILLEDIVLTSAGTSVIGDLVLDLNGHSITAERNYVKGLPIAEISTLCVDGVEMTVIGEGAIKNQAPEAAYAIVVLNSAKVTIKGNVTVGSYYDAFYVRKGQLFIEDGFHYATEYSSPKIADAEECHASTVINCYDNDWGEVSLTGGTYVNMDPSNVHEWREHNRSFVAEGYKVVSEDKGNGVIWYTVVAE